MKDKNGIYHNAIPKRILFKRLLWIILSTILFRPFPTKLFRSWNIFVLKMFGAKIGSKSVVYSSVRIQCPWNLSLGYNSCIGPHCVIENDDYIYIGDNAVVSQYSYLCTSSHNIYKQTHELIYSPIKIGDNAWVCAGSFLGKGITIGCGSVVAARSVVIKDVDNWTIVGGNPASFIKRRTIR